MGQNEHIEKLIQELFTLDQNLKEHEVDLRVLLSELTLKRPDIVPDPAFVTSLRARILLSQRQVPSPFASINFWALRLAPVGALALLLLVLAPQGIFENQTIPDKVAVIEEIAENTDVLRVETGDAPSPVNMYGMGGGNDESMGVAMDSSMSMKSTAVSPEQAPSPLIIYSQEPGMSVIVDSVRTESPSFVVIYTYLPNGQERVVGVSPLIMPGTTTDVPIYLQTQTRIGEVYTATLHTDKGNRVFTYGEDMPVIDAYGNPVSIGFDITSNIPQ
jgi:hypothetical protein